MGVSGKSSESLYATWKDMVFQAKENMRSIREREGNLIEVTSQYPLVGGTMPGTEFTTCLDLARHLYDELRGEGPVRIYVPGSVHVNDRGKADRISLSKAGCDYLMSRGIPSYALFGDDANQMYKGEDGVHSTADECLVASRLFEMLGYGHIHCVCSPGQLTRKAICYIEFGYLPLMHSAPCDESSHDFVDEAFLRIPRILTDGAENPRP